MLDWYVTNTQNLVTIVDFLRFGFTCANKNGLYYGHGTDNAWDDIVALVLGSLSLPLDVDPILLNGRLSHEEKATLVQQLVRRIVERVPVPYLTKTSYFCGLPFFVDERVLIPRSPIGELIEHHFTPWVQPDEVSNILDLCTGSGCIAVACCFAFPSAEVVAVDISREALDVAEINRKRHGLEDNLTLVESDVFDALPPTKYSIIVSNPPYVGADEMQTLPHEHRHEPVLALEACKNGLAVVDKILERAHEFLSDNGILVVEVGNSEEALVDAYPELPFTWLEFERGGQGVFLLTREQLVAYRSAR
jgi:ribosomal protein L3 glutamine methyltransferase